MKTAITDNLRIIGPGIAIAATGVGAGDMIAAAVAGARYGHVILWAAVAGALIKFALNEGLARWQLATGETILEGWTTRYGRGISLIFAAYLFVWSFIVAGALMSACGLAAHAVFPHLSIKSWGILHSIAALLLVYAGRYRLFESLMKIFIGLMFLVIVFCAVLVHPDVPEPAVSLTRPHIPQGAGKLILGVIGGVGGSVTLLNYSYWIREKGWEGPGYKRHISLDLGTAYILTGLFGVAIMIIAAGVQPGTAGGRDIIPALADRLAIVLGEGIRWIFLLGFWGAVFSSMLGVWQGVPYIFADFWQLQRGTAAGRIPGKQCFATVDSLPYRLFLLYLALPPMLLLWFDRPVWIIIVYAIAGACFMPFLALTILHMNNRREWVGRLVNPWYINFLLGGGLLVFAWLLINEIRAFLSGV